ncbi:MAG TPA: J domain-containing protein [Pyrinomonadaceae bacterium]|nr:J domain-containing protein [Pyrinomonadaceae bacterium]
MANYYDILKVSRKASRSEIRSAYRRLARKLHPDRNNGSEESTLEFAKIAEAYDVLSDPVERARYDQQLLNNEFSHGGDSIFSSDNSHARRWRRLVYEHRFNEIVDRMRAEERRESLALQQVIFPTVALFVSCFAVGILRPQFFEASPVFLKILLVTFFLVGVIHLLRRVRFGLDEFTYDWEEIHESIFEDIAEPKKHLSRPTAAAALVIGTLLSLGAGLLLGSYLDFKSVISPNLFAHGIKFDLILYPPIFVLLVDLIHGFASRSDLV